MTNFLFFFSNAAIIRFTIISVMKLTWVPPFDVHILLTKDTYWNYPSLRLAIISHLSCFFSTILGKSLFSYDFRYKSQYWLKFFSWILVPFRNTDTLASVTPAKSYALFINSEVISFSRHFILNNFRSGKNVMDVKDSFLPHYSILGYSLVDILFENVWVYNFSPSQVWRIKRVLKIFANFAPNPFRPPVTFFSVSL